jgi:hypothetical protein
MLHAQMHSTVNIWAFITNVFWSLFSVMKGDHKHELPTNRAENRRATRRASTMNQNEWFLLSIRILWSWFLVHFMFWFVSRVMKINEVTSCLWMICSTNYLIIIRFSFWRQKQCVKSKVPLHIYQQQIWILIHPIQMNIGCKMMNYYFKAIWYVQIFVAFSQYLNFN